MSRKWRVTNATMATLLVSQESRRTQADRESRLRIRLTLFSPVKMQDVM
jgi:hypothetical protein